MTARQRAYLAAYCRVGRKEILKHTDRYSCVASTALTVKTLTRLGIPCAPQAVKLYVRAPALNQAYSCGLSDAELAAAAKVHHCQVEGGYGWRGHLIAVTSDRRYLLDSALDQADAALGEVLGIATEVYVWPCNKRVGHCFRYEALCSTATGVPVELTYVAVDDRTYEPSPAWNDKGITILADWLADEIRKAAA